MGNLRSDQYVIHTSFLIGGVAIKFEIILEGRRELAEPTLQDQLCGISTLTLTDMAPSNMLAHSDRWMDDGVMSRDLQKTITRVREREGWLDRCMQTMAASVPRALRWERVRTLEKRLANKTRTASSTP